MISSFRNFAKTNFAGLLVFIMIIPFVFWGMGSMFSSGNTNTIVKINKENILIAYEPVWAIGTGIIPKQKELFDTIAFIKKKIITKKFD